jgi:hypothetical protein
LCANTLSDLNEDATSFQFQFLSFVEATLISPMRVANEIRPLIVYHNPLIKGVKFEASILPAFLFAPDILCVKAAEFEDRGGVVRLRNCQD